MALPFTEEEVATLRGAVADMMHDQWITNGYTAPHATVYPWQWLWDSCFHALVWSELGDEARALAELERALSTQDSSGFVPHMNYERDPMFHAEFWGRRGGFIDNAAADVRPRAR